MSKISTFSTLEDLFWESCSHQLKYITVAAGGRHSVLLRNDGKATWEGLGISL
jgi:hypothetical protein